MPFSTDFQFVSSVIKKSLKNLAETLAEKEKAPTFAPAFERERVLKTDWGNHRRVEDRGDEQYPVRKKMKKVLGGNGKRITFAVRFREEKDGAAGSEVL